MGASQPNTPNISRRASLNGLSRKPIQNALGKKTGTKGQISGGEAAETDDSDDTIELMFGADTKKFREHQRRIEQTKRRHLRNKSSHSRPRSRGSSSGVRRPRPRNSGARSQGPSRVHSPKQIRHTRSSTASIVGVQSATTDVRESKKLFRVGSRSALRRGPNPPRSPGRPRGSRSRSRQAGKGRETASCDTSQSKGQKGASSDAKLSDRVKNMAVMRRASITRYMEMEAKASSVNSKQNKKDEITRERIISEIVSTEETYVRELTKCTRILVPVACDERIKAQAREGSKPAHALLKVVTSISSILELQKRFLTDLNFYVYNIGEPMSNPTNIHSQPSSNSQSRRESRSISSSNQGGKASGRIGFRSASHGALKSYRRSVGSAAEGLEGSISPSNMTLHSLGDQSKVGAVAGVFLHYGRFFRMYTTYINYFHDAITYLDVETKEGRRVGGMRDAKDILALNAKLILPIQRVPRYLLLLQNLTKYCRSLREDTHYRDTLRALSKERSNMDKIIALQNQIVDGSMILAPQRKLQKEGDSKVTLRTTKGNKVKRPAKMVLFNDLILVACVCPKLSVYLAISVLRARDLPKKCSNPFVKIYLNNIHTEQHGRYLVGVTPTVKLLKKEPYSLALWQQDKGNPDLGVAFFEVLITGIKENLPPLTLEIWNKTGFNSELIGEAVVDLLGLFPEVPAEMDEGHLYKMKMAAWHSLRRRNPNLKPDSASRLTRSESSTQASGCSSVSSVQMVEGQGEIKVMCDMLYSLTFKPGIDPRKVTRICRGALDLTFSKAEKITDLVDHNVVTGMPLDQNLKYYEYVNVKVNDSMQVGTNLDLYQHTSTPSKNEKRKESKIKQGTGRARGRRHRGYNVSLVGEKLELKKERKHSKYARPMEKSTYRSPKSRLVVSGKARIDDIFRARSKSPSIRSTGEADDNKSEVSKFENENWTKVKMGDLSANECHEWIKAINSARKKCIESDIRCEFIKAIHSHNLNKVKECIVRHKLFVDLPLGMDSKQHSQGETALMLCAERGYADMVKVLCCGGATVNKKDSTGQTPLMKATINKHAECVKALLQARADPFIRDNDGIMAIEYYDDADVQMAKVYMEVVKGAEDPATNRSRSYA
ncbi:hypothetical protein AAMO2058_001195100 [Amorphochlora amoebiformis]